MNYFKKLNHFNLRTFLGLAALTLLALFVIFFPVTHSVSSPKPAVKGAVVSKPPMPVSNDIVVPEISANGVFISDLETGVVLYEKNAQTRLMPASLTKIMTALVAMDYFAPDSLLKVHNGPQVNGNLVELKKGDQITTTNLLYALLVPSGNDAAVTFAENYPGGYQAFINRMNDKAQSLGLLNTHFSNVSGVESTNHYTSAYDISMLTKEALKRPQFATIVATPKIAFDSFQGNHYSLETTNLLLGKPGIYGVKTGWTPEAGECLVVLVEKNSHPVIISLLNSKDRFGEAQKLIDWVYQNFSWE